MLHRLLLRPPPQRWLPLRGHLRQLRHQPDRRRPRPDRHVRHRGQIRAEAVPLRLPRRTGTVLPGHGVGAEGREGGRAGVLRPRQVQRSGVWQCPLAVHGRALPDQPQEPGSGDVLNDFKVGVCMRTYVAAAAIFFLCNFLSISSVVVAINFQSTGKLLFPFRAVFIVDNEVMSELHS